MTPAVASVVAGTVAGLGGGPLLAPAVHPTTPAGGADAKLGELGRELGRDHERRLAGDGRDVSAEAGVEGVSHADTVATPAGAAASIAAGPFNADQTSRPPAFINSDATRLPFAEDSFALTMTSPPYMDARTYGIDAHRDCDEWIDWMLVVVAECVRVTAGPVIINCGGVTRDRCYWPGCEGLLYRAWKTGLECYRPAFWHRVGIPGSGGTDWLRADVEYCLCFKRPGELPHFDVSGVGHPPKYAPGGAMSHRLSSGARVNQWGHSFDTGATELDVESEKIISKGTRPSHRLCGAGVRRQDGEKKDGSYGMPVFANPGTLIQGITVGGGHMGHPLAHENEAPYPEGVPEFFIKGWTRPGDRVLDPFSGSGTTANVAARLGRVGIGCDLRMSQCELGRRRWYTPADRPAAVVVDPNQFDLFAGAAGMN